MFQVEMKGLPELKKKLDALSIGTRQKSGRRALGKAARVIRDAAKQNAQRLDDPRTAESIAKNITVRFSSRLFRQTGNLGFRVGVLGGAQQGVNAGGIKGQGKGGDTWYWRLVEFGTEHSAAKPFMRPALEQNIQKATDVFIAEYSRQIDLMLSKGAV